MTPLDKSLKRALKINGHDYVVTLAPDALKITQKGHRLGVELKWADLVSGQSALAVALNASIGKFQDGLPALPRKPNDVARRATATSPRRSTAASPRRAATASAHRATPKLAPPKRPHPR
jgi:hypothetical protein